MASTYFKEREFLSHKTVQNIKVGSVITNFMERDDKSKLVGIVMKEILKRTIFTAKDFIT